MRFFPRTIVPLLAAALVWTTAAPAVAVPVNFYEMPFPCGDTWTGTTRSGHSPSYWSVDFNRTNDLGAPVVAAAPGIVSVAVPNGTRGYGRHVEIEHASGESTLYAHLTTVLVAAGQTVDQGTLIGTVGESGNSTGPHLHFEERLNGQVFHPWFHGAEYVYGTTQTSQNCPTVPMAGNFVGTAAAEFVTFTRSAGGVFQISQPGAAPISIPWGISTDTPILGDWNGDGVTDVGVRRGTDKSFYLAGPSGEVMPVKLGGRADVPVAGDWNGDRTWDIGLRKAGKNVFRLRTPTGRTFPVRLGKAGDLPVTGDWNADGVTDLGVYDMSRARFLLRVVDGNGTEWRGRVVYGSPGDLPVAGDWDGNGSTDLGVWNPATATLSQRIAPTPMQPKTGQRQTLLGRAR